ncbi:MAG: hypothetical protein LBN09_08905 [Clostridioides sp.]|nr:hypothetical protein [Clostridioides sp.]
MKNKTDHNRKKKINKNNFLSAEKHLDEYDEIKLEDMYRKESSSSKNYGESGANLPNYSDEVAAINGYELLSKHVYNLANQENSGGLAGSANSWSLGNSNASSGYGAYGGSNKSANQANSVGYSNNLGTANNSNYVSNPGHSNFAYPNNSSSDNSIYSSNSTNYTNYKPINLPTIYPDPDLSNSDVIIMIPGSIVGTYAGKPIIMPSCGNQFSGITAYGNQYSGIIGIGNQGGIPNGVNPAYANQGGYLNNSNPAYANQNGYLNNSNTAYTNQGGHINNSNNLGNLNGDIPPAFLEDAEYDDFQDGINSGANPGVYSDSSNVEAGDSYYHSGATTNQNSSISYYNGEPITQNPAKFNYTNSSPVYSNEYGVSANSGSQYYNSGGTGQTQTSYDPYNSNPTVKPQNTNSSANKTAVSYYNSGGKSPKIGSIEDEYVKSLNKALSSGSYQAAPGSKKQQSTPSPQSYQNAQSPIGYNNYQSAQGISDPSYYNNSQSTPTGADYTGFEYDFVAQVNTLDPQTYGTSYENADANNHTRFLNTRLDIDSDIAREENDEETI